MPQATSPAQTPARSATEQMRGSLRPVLALPAWPSAVAGACCVIIALLALAPGVRAQGGDSATLLFVAACSAFAFATPLRRIFFPLDEADEPKARGASTFALLCAMSVLFPLSRLYTPIEALAVRVSWSEEPFRISLAAAVAIAGALVTVGPTWRASTGIVKASLFALLAVVWIGLGSFFVLGKFYSVGPTEQVDPTPLIELLMQATEWAALALVCHAASAHRGVRRWVLAAVTVALVVVWARQRSLPPLEQDD